MIIRLAVVGLLLSLLSVGSAAPATSNHVFSVDGERTLLDGKPFLVKGLRLSNALISDETADQLIENLDVFRSYGVNTVSVFLMGSRFGDVKGYRRDGSLDPVYAARLGRIIDAADDRGMVVLVGCLYWGNSRAKWDDWTQKEAEAAVAATASWLKQHGRRNVFIDVDNEGMARREKGFDNRGLVLAAKAVHPRLLVATNFKGPPPAEADLAVHFAEKVPGRPYIQSEGTPEGFQYWGPYSKREGLYDYINKGVYTDEMKRTQIEATREHLRRGDGYMLASTWLQDPPPEGRISIRAAWGPRTIQASAGGWSSCVLNSERASRRDRSDDCGGESQAARNLASASVPGGGQECRVGQNGRPIVVVRMTPMEGRRSLRFGLPRSPGGPLSLKRDMTGLVKTASLYAGVMELQSPAVKVYSLTNSPGPSERRVH